LTIISFHSYGSQPSAPTQGYILPSPVISQVAQSNGISSASQHPQTSSKTVTVAQTVRTQTIHHNEAKQMNQNIAQGHSATHKQASQTLQNSVIGSQSSKGNVSILQFLLP